MVQNGLRQLIAVEPGVPDRMTDCNHCAGLSRSRLLHRAAAEAGRGLPAIEPGMPLPAGTGLSRRSFVAQSVGAMLAVYGSSRLGLSALEEGIAAAATGAAQPVLVSVFLEGGADALSVLSPQGDPLYQKLRPKLALSGGAVFAEDGRLHWHPAANGLTQLYGEKKVTVMPAVGYTNADRPLHVAPLLGGRRDEHDIRTGARALSHVAWTSLASGSPPLDQPVPASIDGPTSTI
jgi:hypothetical protein